MHVQNYLQLAYDSEEQLENAFKKVASHHKEEPDIHSTCLLLASWSERHKESLKSILLHFEKSKKSNEPERLTQILFKEPRKGSLALLRDLHDLWLITKEIELCWKILLQAAQAMRNDDIEKICKEFSNDTKRQSDWLLTRIKQASPQLLVATA